MSEMIYKCRRCLKRPNETYRPDPNEVLKVCAECGTENWCLPVRGKTKAKKASEVAKGEVDESIPTEEAAKIVAATMVETTKTLSGLALSKKDVESVTEAVNETLTERETLLARLAKLDAEETE